MAEDFGYFLSCIPKFRYGFREQMFGEEGKQTVGYGEAYLLQ
jgi:hypothetical protein